MHVNLLQYRHYLDRAGKSATLNRVILLTPNEGLSAQHLDEFAASVIPAASFDKNETKMYAGSRVDVVEVTKLADKSGDKTIDVAAFRVKQPCVRRRGTSGRKRRYLDADAK